MGLGNYYCSTSFMAAWSGKQCFGRVDSYLTRHCTDSVDYMAGATSKVQ